MVAIDGKFRTCYCIEVQPIERSSRATHLKTTMSFLSKAASAAIAPRTGGAYLSPSKISDGGSVRFALLSDEPLEFYEAWGQDASGSLKPFRFPHEPTPEEVVLELGNYEPRTRDNGSLDVKFCIALPVYHYEDVKVKVLQLSQKSIISELDQIAQHEDFEDLLSWDFTLGRTGSKLTTVYTLRAVPRKAASQKALEAAWTDTKAAGFDLNRLLIGGDPFKA